MSYKRLSMELKSKPIKLIFTKLIREDDFGDEQGFRERLSDDPGMAKEFQRLERIWRESGNTGLFTQIDTEADWELVRSRVDMPILHKHHTVPTYKYFLRIAAMVFLTAGLSTGIYKTITFIHQNGNESAVNIMAGNSLKEIRLPDGSKVSLNAGSRLVYSTAFGRQLREVKLEGEALFEVLPDVVHPFRVYTGESVVEVTGTRFSIRQEDGSIKVAVISGTVLLSNKGDVPRKIRISANQSGYLLSGNELKLENSIETNELSWKTGHLTFDETPIDSALVDIARHFRKELLIETDISEEITAEFQNQPLGEILNEITQVAGLKFDTSGTALIVRK